MIVARIVAGFGLGIVNSTVPVLQSEFSPKANRGLCKSILLSRHGMGLADISCSRLHAAYNSQLWHGYGVLDRLRIQWHNRKLRMAGPLHSPMHLPLCNVDSALIHPRDAQMACGP